MNIRSALKWLNDALRPTHVADGEQAEKQLTSDKDDALAIGLRGSAPTDYVPSQQDERPR